MEMSRVMLENNERSHSLDAHKPCVNISGWVVSSYMYYALSVI